MPIPAGPTTSTTSTSRIPAVTDALVTVFSAALPATLQVRDGPLIRNAERAMVLVGCDDGEASGAVRAQQRWAGLGHVTRDEAMEIPCLVWTSGGDNVIKTLRDEAFGYLASIEETLRTNETLGMSGELNIRAEIGPTYTATGVQEPNGVTYRIAFTVNAQARI